MKTSTKIAIFPRVTFLDKLLFTKHLSIMIKSGITIVEALQILIDENESTAFKKILASVLSDIQNGKTLEASLAKYPKIFDSFYLSLIKVGEESGTIEESLKYLSKQLSKEYVFRQKIRGAMMYPAIVLTAAAIIGIGISIFVLPQLIDLFKGFDVKLPITTQILLFFANIAKNYGIFILILSVLFIFLFRAFIKNKKIKPIWDLVILDLPIIGKIIQNSELTTIMRSLGVMIRSGLTITNALEIETNIAQNEVFKKYANQMFIAVTKGKSLSQELSSGKYSKIPLIATKMIAVGEKTGKLDETFLYLGSFFEAEVDDATKNLSTILEPVLLLFIGLVVAFVALSIISPIYELTGSIK